MRPFVAPGAVPMLDWKSLAALSNEELGQRDVAEMNLACADGLPDEPTPAQIAECLARLDHYARCTADYTERRMPEFRRRPEHYDNSEAVFRVVCLITLLQRQFHVLYNPAKVPLDAPLETADVFIHGALLGAGGTCASLPVVYAAGGRRLGYPLKLAHARSHLLTRWDDPQGERFNIEANETGVNTPPDDHYRTGRFASSAQHEKFGCLLKSLTPREELAGFLAGRGFRWLDVGRWRMATDSFARAWALAPENIALKNRLISTMNGWRDHLRGREPDEFPSMYFTWPPRRYPESLPWDNERDILSLEAEEYILTDPRYERDWWGPLRRGEPLELRPVAAVVQYRGECCGIRLEYALRGLPGMPVTDLSGAWGTVATTARPADGAVPRQPRVVAALCRAGADNR